MHAPPRFRIFAPAKVNLTLHVSGQRADGYHLIDSLVCFADIGDEVVLHTGDANSVVTVGPEAKSVPSDMNNLVLKVAGLFGDSLKASFFLTKNLPVASGIGGGSADAAAAYRGLAALAKSDQVSMKRYNPKWTSLDERLLALGADIPMCVQSRCARIRGIGDVIDPIIDFPPLYAVLINPRCAVSTPSVFEALKHKDNTAMPEAIPDFSSTNDLTYWLGEQRNDLEESATEIEPAISDVKAALSKDPNCQLARMSGSGATCFGLYDSLALAQEGAKTLAMQRPDWWVQSARLGSQFDRALPRIS